MRKLMLVLVCLSATIAMAQTKVSSSWTCSKPNPMNSIPVGDKADHSYMIDQFHCTASKGEIAGIKDKEGTGTEFGDVTGNSSKSHGIFVETLANGDKLHANLTSAATMTKDGKLESVSNKWEVTEGTGKVKGIKASGSCTGKAAGDNTEFTCNGTYTMPK